MGHNTFEVTDNNFQEEVLKSATPVLVDFWADWCGPCKMIAPIVDDLAKQYDGQLRVGKMDVDINPNIPPLYDIQGIPSLLLFKDGQVVEYIKGYKTRDQMERLLKAHLQPQNA